MAGETRQAKVRQPGHDEDLVGFLEPDQLVTDKSRPIPRAPLGARANAALWALRIFVLIVGGMVIYTFVSQLGS
jgi:hypothetical protein